MAQVYSVPETETQMIDLSASVPTIFHTYDSITAHSDLEGTDEIWHADLLNRPAMDSTRIAFDAPESWEWGQMTLVFAPAPDGLWVWRSYSDRYEAVRAETPTHVILTGTWRQIDYAGAFVAVLPKSSNE